MSRYLSRSEDPNGIIRLQALRRSTFLFGSSFGSGVGSGVGGLVSWVTKKARHPRSWPIPNPARGKGWKPDAKASTPFRSAAAQPTELLTLGTRPLIVLLRPPAGQRSTAQPRVGRAATSVFFSATQPDRLCATSIKVGAAAMSEVVSQPIDQGALADNSGSSAAIDQHVFLVGRPPVEEFLGYVST